MTLVKYDIISSLAEEVDISKRDAKVLVECFFEEISDFLSNGEAVKLSGFGNFEVRTKNARPGLNPKTKEKKQISARRVVTFKAGKKLKSIIQDAQS